MKLPLQLGIVISQLESLSSKLIPRKKTPEVVAILGLHSDRRVRPFCDRVAF